MEPSTIASLYPSEPRDLNFRVFKSSSRLQGSHLMVLKQPSRDSESIRKYAPGDPPQLIDWRAYARTDQVMIREMRDEAAARVGVFLEAGETLHWPTPEISQGFGWPATMKIEVATRVALNICHLHIIAGDIVELWLLDASSANIHYVRRPRSASDILGIFEVAQRSAFKMPELLGLFEESPDYGRRVDVAYWVGDCLSDLQRDEVLENAKRSLLLHTLSAIETDISVIRDQVCYFDAAGLLREFQGKTLLYDNTLERSITRWIDELKSAQQRRGGQYVQLNELTKLAAYFSMLEAFCAF